VRRVQDGKEKMVRNEKGLWVKAKVVKEAGDYDDDDDNGPKPSAGRGRGGGGKT